MQEMQLTALIVLMCLVWSAAESTSELDLEPLHLPRRMKVPKRMDDGTSDGDFSDCPKELYRPIYFQIIDLL